MNMPGFTAEASLLRSEKRYWMVVGFVQSTGSTISPLFCDFECLTDCFFDCQDLPPRFRAACARNCRRRCCH
jgi:hypothetical protein